MIWLRCQDPCENQLARETSNERTLSPNASGGMMVGQWHGRSHGAVKRVIAKEGYVVTAVIAKSGHRIDGMRLLFMRVENGHLNPDDTYRSPWIGGLGGGRESLYASYGKPIIGVFGGQGADVDRIGFVQADVK